MWDAFSDISYNCVLLSQVRDSGRRLPLRQGKVVRYCLLLKNENGIYDKVAMYADKVNDTPIYVLENDVLSVISLNKDFGVQTESSSQDIPREAHNLLYFTNLSTSGMGICNTGR